MFLQRLCLKPTHSLRWQLLLSFGSSTFLCLSVVLVVSIVLSRRAGLLVQERAGLVMRQQVERNLAQTTQSTAEALTEYLSNMEGVAQLISEVVMDRIVGYPEPGWAEDEFVPFRDILSERNIYPLQNDPLPLDWNITLDLTPENARELLQEKESWAAAFRDSVTLTSGSFFLRGTCDPDANVGEIAYIEGCSLANNDVVQGGVVAPTPTADGLYQKSGDIGILMRPLYESNPDLITLGVYFVNSGAGANMHYPGHIADGSNTDHAYTSLGCEWMRNINPNTDRPYGTEEDIQRCHPRGTRVNARDYNGNERDWFQEFVAAEGKVVWFGPYIAAGADIALVTVGKAVFDRKSGELIGCVTVDLSLTRINKAMSQLKPAEHTSVAVVDYETGALIVNSEDEGFLVPTNTMLSDIGITSEEIVMGQLRTSIEKALREGWEPGAAEAAFSNVSVNLPYGILFAYPLPVPPEEYDPEFRPQNLVIQTASEDVFAPITDFEDSIDEEIRDVAFVTVAIGIFGLAATLAFVWCISRMLTQPLLWIEAVSKNILKHADKSSGRLLDENFETSRWTPNTEIMDLVASFKKMIEGFSGDRPPSVAENDYGEIRNSITWQSDFCQLYERGLDFMKSGPSNTSAATPQTEEESRDVSASKDEEIGVLQPKRDLPKQNSAPGGPVWQSDFNPSFMKDGGQVRNGRALSFVAGSSHTFNLKEPIAISVVPAPPKQNIGRNIPVASSQDEMVHTDGWLRVSRSKLFRWILILLVTPLILATAVISVLVTINIVSTVPDWVDSLAAESLDLSRENLASLVTLKCRHVEEMLAEPLRDLYLFTRIANWVHSSAIPRSNSFTEVDYATEECNNYFSYGCPLFEVPGRFPCPCSWGDPPTVGTCTEQNRPNTRPLQIRFHSCQSKGRINEFTGERTTAFGIVIDHFPNETEWWGDPMEMPGVLLYDTNPTLSTTYSRTRVSSSFAVVEFPIFNYATELGRQNHHLGTFTGYEADGLFTGFGGCSYNYPNYAYFVSSSENRAAEIRPALCPIGEYGYDPRCRSWYEDTRIDFEQNGAFVHVTPPYVFSDDLSIGLSAASPILDVERGVMLGEVLLDFIPVGMWEAFEKIDKPISFMVAVQEDFYGGDTIIGPNRTQGWESDSITNLLFPFDGEDSPYRREFEPFLADMKNNKTGTFVFKRTTKDGKEEELAMSFHPVYHRFLRPIDPRNLTRGVEWERKQTYSLGIASYDTDMTAAFGEVKNEMEKDLKRLAIIDIVCAVLFATLFIAFAFRVSIHATKPMILLLEAVESINSGEAKENIQPQQGGSREFSQVYTSFSKLNKVVGISNKAFFSGSLDWAYHFIYDALQLFRKIDDQKAIGIACNNLGNTIFAMAIQGQPLWMLNTPDVEYVTVLTALDYYEEAINICKRAFDEAEDSFQKAEYAQHLADRHFNRGLYLLFIEHESDAPQDCRIRALDDIARARDMDCDVRDFFLEKKLLFQYSDKYFWRLIRRIFGLSTHCFDEELREVWDVRDLIQDADRLLFAAWNETSAPVFDDLGRINRLQQLEAAALRLELCEGNTAEAARMAMRMFAEDEYLLECAFPVAATAILESMRSDDGIAWSRGTCRSFRSDLRLMSSSCRNVSLDLGKCFIFTLELNERWEGGSLLAKVKEHCLRIFDKYCKDEDHVGVAAYTVRGDQTLSLSRKLYNATKQRSMLDVATTSTSEMVSPSLPFAMQMVVDSAETMETDSFVLLLTDGYSWDQEGYRAIKQQIERMNRERKSLIHLIIVGLDIEDEEVVDECRGMCSVSKPSLFVEATLENVDAVFASIISVVNPLDPTGPALQGITMERF